MVENQPFWIIMIVETEFKRLMHQLIREKAAVIKLGDSDVTVHVSEPSNKVSLASVVYVGENFVPHSVRRSLRAEPAFKRGAPNSYLLLDEDSYRISLHYNGSLNQLNKRMFVDLLEGFSLLADRWRTFLDELDRQDLIHVYSNG